ncbi:hypothetical protein EXU57_00790 [Segetibacter sp. 3557_3]|uniref:bifunctional YncE family protein/alkaline phosphatase family protein n=1 Tax=Segetibacter sp. 3557_3 TaxID=2547429 RepID=UPI001058520F|nr:bifunctional YncE family protein/alkaline phosphatase family protein [Segetibacter sp. 3557_3]TDH28647.1 hypothetical protein EXU57_00790 [Segetibacter sp. 3557_3]
MKYFFLSFFSIIITTVFGQTLPSIEQGRVQLPNGWRLTPVGKSLPLGDLPLNMAVSPSGQYVAITNNGRGAQSIQLFDAKSRRELDSVPVDRAWYGLAFGSNDQFLYASGGNNNIILKYSITNRKLKLIDSLVLGTRWPTRISPGGIAINEKANMLYVVTKENNSLYILDLKSKQVVERFDLPGEAYTCVFDANKNLLYISCWGCDKVLQFDVLAKRFTREIGVGDNPNEMVLSKNGRYLYVCNANDNTVSLIDLEKGAVIETLNTALFADAPAGSTPNGLALSANEEYLYIANADNNCLSVFEVEHPGKSVSKGFIPTGWYPTNVKVINKQIWVTNGKGLTSLPNPRGPNPAQRKTVVTISGEGEDESDEVQHISALFKGSLSIIPQPAAPQLAIYSKAVYNNTPYNKKIRETAEGKAGNPVPTRAGGKSPIKYVFYVIKENRTYDQVLGDMKEGNGDTSLVLFGERITPNQHQLARDFVLLDNFFVDAEVSVDGHSWTMGAYATDFIEKHWPAQYSNRGGVSPAAGKRAIANNKTYIWNLCKDAGLSYRTYGEFSTGTRAHLPVLNNHVCPYFKEFDMTVPDTTRFSQWKRDFDSLLALNAVPRFSSIRMGNDHTEGLKLNRPTPFAHVADNDLAVGLFIEHLSKSPIWNETAVFIIEDDAQNGADHVDAHRSTAYLAGGFVKRGMVDHTPYTTSSMLRTIELILGLPPMSQYDAAATPMWRCFDTISRPYNMVVKTPAVNLKETNKARNAWQRRSELFDLAKEDSEPDVEFNEVLWYGIKGPSIPFPGPKRAAFLKVVEADDDDD